MGHVPDVVVGAVVAFVEVVGKDLPIVGFTDISYVMVQEVVVEVEVLEAFLFVDPTKFCFPRRSREFLCYPY